MSINILENKIAPHKRAYMSNKFFIELNTEDKFLMPRIRKEDQEMTTLEWKKQIKKLE